MGIQFYSYMFKQGYFEVVLKLTIDIFSKPGRATESSMFSSDIMLSWYYYKSFSI